MIGRFAHALSDSRPALPVPWPSLAEKLRLVPGTLVLLVGGPGVGKSLVSLVWALSIEERTPVRLLSIDTDSQTQGIRTVAYLRGLSTADVYNERHEWAEWLAQRDLRLSIFDATATVEELGEMVVADTLWYGTEPGLVIVDDVSKLDLPGREYGDYDEAFLGLHRLGRSTGSVVLALHHLNRLGGSQAGESPIKLHDVRFGGTYEAEVVLGLWRPRNLSGGIRVSILKNRYGMADPSGQDVYVDLNVNFSHASVTEMRRY